MNNSTSYILKALAFGALACGVAFAPAADAQTTKQLILHSPPGDPTVIELQGNMQFDDQGNIKVTPVDPEACTATGDCEGVAVAISSFTVNGAASNVSVAQGESLRFRWQTQGAWACDGSGMVGWNETGKNPVNSVGQVISTSSLGPGNYTAELACYNGTVFAENTRSVNIEITDEQVSPPPVPAECTSRTMPSTWVRKTTGGNSCSYGYQAQHGLKKDHDCRYFNKVWPFDFDQQTSLQRVLGVGTTNSGRAYIALEFNSGNVPADAQKKITVGIPQSSNLDNRNKILSVSKCPGDFNADEINVEMGPGCIINSWLNSFTWGGSSARSDANRCALEPNQTYYFNIIYTGDPVGTDPSQITPHPDCSTGAGCGTRFSADNM